MTRLERIDLVVSVIDNIETMNDPTANITALLQAAASGQSGDINALMEAIYDDLHRLAARHLRSERPDHTLQPTALVNEAWLKLVDQRNTTWHDRSHFFAIAARVIRRILVDHARTKRAAKRGFGLERVPLDDLGRCAATQQIDLLALDEALAELQELDERQAKIVELRFFAGMSIDEIAEVLGIGPRSVDRHWSAAKAWLMFQLSDRDDTNSGAHGNA